MTSKIHSIEAHEIMASRGTLGLEVVVTTDTGATGRSTPSSGVSTGKYEATFVIDGGNRFDGKGLLQAVANINKVTPQLIGMDVSKQREIDSLLLHLDDTPDKSNLGANAMVGISLAVCKAAANAADMPLYQYIGGVNANTMPMPIFGICLCGRYSNPGKTRWLKPSYEIIPYGASGFENAVEIAYEMQRAFRDIIVNKYGINTYRQQSLENSYSAFWMPGVIKDDREILDAMTEAIVSTKNEEKIGIYYDAAAGCYYEADSDSYTGIYSAGGKSREQMISLYKNFVANYPLISLEDPLHEEDMEGHAILTQELGIEIVGDDLFTTNIERVKMGVDYGAANSMVLKITQVGTVSEALDAANFCHQNNYNVHPCGSRGDRDSIADFALGLRAGQVRSFDWHRMRTLEQTLGTSAVWPGKALFKGHKQG